MNLYPNLILDILKTITYPGDSQNIVAAGMVYDDLRIEGNKVSFSLIAKRLNDPFIRSVVKASEASILTHISADIDVKGNISIKYPEPSVLPKVKKSIDAKNIIAISSGKGGVGKSTVSANLAVTLAKQGYKVGLLDADIFGPSIPKMFGLEGYKPTAENIDGKYVMTPAEKFGVKILSIGFFVDTDSAVVWRGAMASNAIRQMVEEAAWGKLDYMLVDLPPGTSDIHLTTIDVLKFSGAIVVSTPQSVALADAIKGIEMFENSKINIKILGLVENMAYFTPAELPQNKYYIFGKDGVKKLAEKKNLPLLSQIPIIQDICNSGDNGSPAALTVDTIYQKYLQIVKKIS